MGRLLFHKLLLLLVVTVLVGPNLLPAEARTTAQHRVFLPLVSRAAPDINGEWLGYLIQPGKSFQFELSLTQRGGTVQGTSTARDGVYFATWSLTGLLGDTTLTLNEQSITNSNSRPGWRWCIKQMNLDYTRVLDNTPSLSGMWSDPGCNAGRLYLQPKSRPYPQMSGIWQGIITQGDDIYSLELELVQDGSTFQGNAFISRGDDAGLLSLVGHVAGQHLQIEEQEVLGTTGLNWCIKTMVLTYRISEQGPLIEGSWTAPLCTPGEVSLLRRAD